MAHFRLGVSKDLPALTLQLNRILAELNTELAIRPSGPAADLAPLNRTVANLQAEIAALRATTNPQNVQIISGGIPMGFPLSADGDANGFDIFNLGHALPPAAHFALVSGLSPLNELATATANYDMDGHKFLNVLAPSASGNVVVQGHGASVADLAFRTEHGDFGDYLLSGGSTDLDFSLDQYIRATLTANSTLNLIGAVNGQLIILKVIQDAFGGWIPAITSPSTLKWIGGAPPVFSVAANAIDLVGFLRDENDDTYCELFRALGE